MLCVRELLCFFIIFVCLIQYPLSFLFYIVKFQELVCQARGLEPTCQLMMHPNEMICLESMRLLQNLANCGMHISTRVAGAGGGGGESGGGCLGGVGGDVVMGE